MPKSPRRSFHLTATTITLTVALLSVDVGSFRHQLSDHRRWSPTDLRHQRPWSACRLCLFDSSKARMASARKPAIYQIFDDDDGHEVAPIGDSSSVNDVEDLDYFVHNPVVDDWSPTTDDILTNTVRLRKQRLAMSFTIDVADDRFLRQFIFIGVGDDHLGY